MAVDLSVIIPCYNAEDTIGEQLEALTRQVWDGSWEVVVADNGSTDGSREVVESFRDRLPRLRSAAVSTGQGPSHSRNAGVRCAHGDRILLCDADDVVADDFVPVMARALEEHDFVACRLEETRLNERWQAESWKNGQKDGLLASSSHFLPYAGGGTLGFRMYVFDRVGGFDEGLRVREDTDFCWRVQLAGVPLHFVAETEVHYRYPTEYGNMFRQSRLLAKHRVLLYKRYRPLGLPKVPMRKALRGRHTWRKLLKRALRIRSQDRAARATLVRDLGDKAGRLQGSLRARTLLL